MSRFEVWWILSLFGTAVGAGILFLPIRAGAAGIWPVIIMAILVFPMVYLGHRGLARFVASGDGDITQSSQTHFGTKMSLFVALLYFFAFYTICLAYCVGITNTVESAIYYQLAPLLSGDGAIKSAYIVGDDGLARLSGGWRFGLVFVLVSLMMGVMACKLKAILRVCEMMVWPLCLMLLGFSLYLIGYWDLKRAFLLVPDMKTIFLTMWLTLPVLIFSFEHAPAISTFAQSMKQVFSESENRSERVLFRTALLLLGFVMFFVASCVLALSPAELAEAKAQNISVLSYFANKFDEPIISYGGPVIAIIAIATSFFGHYFGAKEGAIGLVRAWQNRHEARTELGFDAAKMAQNDPEELVAAGTTSQQANKSEIDRRSAFAVAVAMYISMILVGYFNPSVLGVIEKMGGPIITAMLFILPVAGAYYSSAMRRFRSIYSDIFMLLTGLITIATVIYLF